MDVHVYVLFEVLLHFLMCVCMVCMHIYTPCIHTYVHPSIHTCRHAPSFFTSPPKRMHTYTHTYMHTYMQAYPELLHFSTKRASSRQVSHDASHSEKPETEHLVSASNTKKDARMSLLHHTEQPESAQHISSNSGMRRDVRAHKEQPDPEHNTSASASHKKDSRVSLTGQRLSTCALGKPTRELTGMKPTIPAPATAVAAPTRKSVGAVIIAENKDIEMANLCDACEQLRAKIAEYEENTNRCAHYVHVCMYVCMYVCTYVCLGMMMMWICHGNMHRCTYTHTYTHTHGKHEEVDSPWQHA